jgi:hypothetical protein
MEEKELTFGEKLVGLSFNPSGNEKVNRVKELCAELANLTHNEYWENNHLGKEINEILYQHTIGEILNAQMNVVKLITLK